jgi:hypothetical protein
MIRMLVFLALVLTLVAAAGCEPGNQARQTSAATAPAVPMN